MTEQDSSRYAARKGAVRTTASIISYVLNPIVLPPLAFALILIHFGAGRNELWSISASAALFFAVIPLVYIVFLVKTGQARSLELRDRTRRKGPLLVTLASAIAGIIAMYVIGKTARPLLLACAGCFFINVALALLVTLRWKISLHMIGISGFLSVCLFVALRSWPWAVEDPLLILELLVPSLLLIPVLMWARVRSGAHTIPQVLAGGLAGFLLPMIQLWLIVDILFRDVFVAV